MRRSRPGQDLRVLAFGRHDATSSRVGQSVALTPHNSGTGFNVQLRALPLDGRLVLLPPDPANSSDERNNKDR